MTRAKQLRLDKGLTLSDVAEATKVARHTIRKLEAGNEIQAPSLARLSSFYEATSTELLGPAHFSTPNGEAA